MNIDYCNVRKEANKLVQKGPDTLFQTGKRPLTPRAKNVITYAQEESKNMGLKYVGTEHILLGLLREEEGVACQILKNLNLGIADARQHVYNLLGVWGNLQTKENDDFWIPVRPASPSSSRLPTPDDLEKKPSAKEEFEEYVKNRPNRDLLDLNSIFREWMFKKIDEGFRNAKEC